jgi:hypothetical protein
MLIKISDTQIYSDAFIRKVSYAALPATLNVVFADSTTAVVSGEQATYIWNTLNSLYDGQPKK